MNNQTVEQGSDAWHQARLGKVTASRISDVMAKVKSGGWSASRANYMAELLLERLTGTKAPRFVSKEMLDGIEREPRARIAYEFLHNVTVQRVGLIDHPTIPMAAASPDGFIGDDGVLEIKCPLPATHLDTLDGASLDAGYIKQIQFQMACSGRHWDDFVSFNPDFPAKMQLFVQRVTRDDAMIKEIEAEVVKFLGELDEKEAMLRSKYQNGG
jgi:putative phage-type endonuclease